MRRVLLDRPAPLVVEPDAFLLTTAMGLEIDEDRFVDYNWPRALHALGIRYRKFHATRHTFITCALANPRTNIKWLADYVGTSIAMIEAHYAPWIGHDEQQLAYLAESERNVDGTWTEPEKRVSNAAKSA